MYENSVLRVDLTVRVPSCDTTFSPKRKEEWGLVNGTCPLTILIFLEQINNKIKDHGRTSENSVYLNCFNKCDSTFIVIKL